MRWLGRQEGRSSLHSHATILDVGCGNGRNLIYLAKEFGARGVGYDSSAEAVAQARTAGKGLPVEFRVRSLQDMLPLPDASVTLALDMMSSHVLHADERAILRDELWRVLRPGGWLFFKTFLADGDLHLRRLTREHGAAEPNSYIHPTFGHFEHAWTIDELEEFFLPQFEIHKLDKSHKHLRRRGGRTQAFRRRTVSAYLQRRD